MLSVLLLACLTSSETDTTPKLTIDTGTDSTDTGTDTGTDSTDTGQQDTEPPEAFVLEAWTDDSLPGLQLYTNLPSAPKDCARLHEAPCDDLDRDGLVDAWEGVVLEHLRPVVRMDEDEPLVLKGDGLLINVARIWPVSETEIRLVIVLAYSEDYGRCGVTEHPGDSERVALSVTVSEEWATVRGAYTAAHEGELNDLSTRYLDDDIGLMETTEDPETGDPRWLVYASEGKHATYSSNQHCEDAHFLPCLEEDCSPDGVSDPLRFDILPDVAVNAGEPGAPLADDLTDVGMPGELIWTDQTFCGGLGRTDDDACSSALLEKMLSDPFAE